MTLSLNNEEKTLLLRLARLAIETQLEERPLVLSDIGMTPKLQEKRATFVTLTIDGKLRGCIGDLVPEQALYLDVIENARSAAFDDPRFLPLAQPELEKTQIEISILGLPERLKYSSPADLIDYLAAKHLGVVLSKGAYRATFLPQVWEELPEPEQFLAHLCLKANLSPDEWQYGVTIETYQVEKIQE